MNMHVINMWLTDAADGGCGADWTSHPWRHNSSNVGVVTAGLVGHNSSRDNRTNRAFQNYALINHNC